MATKILRQQAVLAKLSIGKTLFQTQFVASGRVRPVRIGGATAYFEDEIDALVEDLRRERDRGERPQPRLRADTSPSKSQKPA